MSSAQDPAAIPGLASGVPGVAPPRSAGAVNGHGGTGTRGGAKAGGDAGRNGADSDADLEAWLGAEVRRRLAATPHASHGSTHSGDPTAGWELVRECVSSYAYQALRAGRIPPTPTVEDRAARRVFDGLFAYGGLQPLLDDPSVENINCNGADQVFVRRADGTREQVGPVAASDEDLVGLVRRIAARSGAAGQEERRLDRGSPAVSLELPDGGRLFAVLSVSRRVCVAIRRDRVRLASMRELQHAGTFDAGLRSLLTAAVRARLNIVISGGTQAGKTTLLRALASAIPASERLVTVEDSYELALDRDTDAHPDLVCLQAREANIEGQGAVPAAELVRWALRMSPDRVIVGEVRGPEVTSMLWAMSQGNDGSLSTVHASSSRQAPIRLATYLLAAEQTSLAAAALLISGAVHLIVHLAAAADGSRVVASIREVVDADGDQVVTNEIWTPAPDGRAIPAAPIRPETMTRLMAAGFEPDLATRNGWRPS